MSKSKFDKLNNVGKSAALSEQNTKAVSSEYKSKLLGRVPVGAQEKHAELKAQGKTSLTFSAYIIEALIEKLERDLNK